MRKSVIILLVLLVFDVWSCNPQTGEREQRVFADLNGHVLAKWSQTSSEPKVFELESGLTLGIMIKDAEPEAYAGHNEVFPFTPELVSIELFDMGTVPPTSLSKTWGGANSIQGFGSLGGANRVDELGNPGLSLHLVKPVCSVAIVTD